VPSTPRAFRRSVGLIIGLLLAIANLTLGAPSAHAAEDAKLVLVLDSSGSMKERVSGQTKIKIAKSALNTVVNRLPSSAQVGLRVYGATVFDKSDAGACTDSQLVVPIGTDNRDALRAEIKKYQPYGETPISYSLKQAAKDLGPDGRRTIVLVSDGEETCRADPCDTAAAIAKQGIDLKIDVIGLGVRGKARSQLRCVAKRGNGTYYDADNQAEIEDSLDKLATRAFRPFRLTGAPIEGATKKAKAPLAAPGQYIDNFPGNVAPLYYRLPRSAPGSTLHVGFTALPLGDAGWVAGVSLKLYNSDGRECDWGYGGSVGAGSGDPLLTADAASWRSDDDDPCNTESELLLEVTALMKAMGGVKFELLVVEEPPIVSARHLPPSQQRLVWKRMKAGAATKAPVAGRSISDAPVIAAGTYRTTILTGETQVFAVDSDWGQQVQVMAVVAPRRGAMARALGVQNHLDLQLIGPMRGQYVNLQVEKMPRPDTTMADDKKAFRKYGSTPTISYLNRTAAGAEASASVPGRQYLALNMAAGKDQRFLVPYTFVVKVIGTAGEGRPEYAGAPSPTPTPTPEASAFSTPTETPPADTGSIDGGVPILTVVGIAAGALALGAAGAGAAMLVRRPRSPRL